jgi:hypothetical protein
LTRPRAVVAWRRAGVSGPGVGGDDSLDGSGDEGGAAIVGLDLGEAGEHASVVR